MKGNVLNCISHANVVNGDCFITSFPSFPSYGRMGSKLNNIHLPVLISTILNILDTILKCEGIVYSTSAFVL